jgi:F420-dependent oxidoreductase-like protein
VKVSLQIPHFGWPGGPSRLGPTLAEIARTADACGFGDLWVMDHVFQIRGLGRPEDPMLEGYSALNFMAGVTQRVGLGTMVTAATYRAPGLLVKRVTTLDVLSGGRAWLGIGAGWNEQEAAGLGLPFPPRKERFERLEETLQVAKQMWSGEVTPYRGRHLELAEPINNPPTVRRPRPPILIGGGGERKTLRLVAQYADACNLFSGIGPEGIRHKFDVLKRHCENVGRDYATVEKTVLLAMYSGSPTIAELIPACKALADLGVQTVLLSGVPDIHAIAPLERIGREVIPEVAGF